MRYLYIIGTMLLVGCGGGSSPAPGPGNSSGPSKGPTNDCPIHFTAEMKMNEIAKTAYRMKQECHFSEADIEQELKKME